MRPIMMQHPAVVVVVVVAFIGSLLSAPLDTARAFDLPIVTTTTTRRQMMGWTGIATASMLIGTVPEKDAAHAVDILRSKGCYSGEGEGCADLAEDNALIRSLQEKSFANKERNAKEARDAYYNKNYPDFFASVGQVMIKKTDGSFLVVSASEAAALQKAGRLYLQSATTKGGGTDFTQKPILSLKEE